MMYDCAPYFEHLMWEAYDSSSPFAFFKKTHTCKKKPVQLFACLCLSAQLSSYDFQFESHLSYFFVDGLAFSLYFVYAALFFIIVKVTSSDRSPEIGFQFLTAYSQVLYLVIRLIQVQTKDEMDACLINYEICFTSFLTTNV